MNNRKKNESTLVKKVFIIVVGVLGVGILAFIALVIYAINSGPPTDISNIEGSATLIIDSSGESVFDVKKNDEILNWYDSLDKALEDTSLIENEESFYFYQIPIVDEIIRFEDEERLQILYGTKNIIEGRDDILVYVGFYIMENKISQPYKMFSRSFDPIMEYTFDCDDSVVEYIEYEYAWGERIVNNDSIIYYGAWRNKEELESLTINGKPLDEIIPVEIGENTYYFWHIAQSEIQEQLKEINWSSYTYQQIIDLLSIEYKKAETE